MSTDSICELHEVSTIFPGMLYEHPRGTVLTLGVVCVMEYGLRYDVPNRRSRTELCATDDFVPNYRQVKRSSAAE
jgi:hypothetical protein